VIRTGSLDLCWTIQVDQRSAIPLQLSATFTSFHVTSHRLLRTTSVKTNQTQETLDEEQLYETVQLL
jgi:hypothetical protein